MAVAEWYLSPANLSCENCAKEFARMNRETPCFTCEIPEIHPENEIVWDIFRLIKSQIRVSAGGDFLGYDLSLIPAIIQSKGLPVWMVEDVLHAITVISDVAVRINQETRAASK